MTAHQPPPSLLAQRAEKLTATFQLLPDGDERLHHLISLGRRYPALDPTQRVETNLLAGCISHLWLWPHLRDGLGFFHMDADALISKGMAALICELYNAAPPDAVAAYQPDFLGPCGLAALLSRSRQSGLGSLRREIRDFARRHLPATNFRPW